LKRILVAGSSGAGKTTLARQLARRLDLPFVEIDSLFHGPNWVPREEFVEDVDAFTSQPAWVLDHDYSAVRHLVWSRIDTFIWLDYSRFVCECRVIKRSIPRSILRRELWNGNYETVGRMLFDAEHPVRWSWTHHAGKRNYFEDLATSPDNAHITVVRLRRPRETRSWLDSLS
jgi:adenylate kinase family enzyme